MLVLLNPPSSANRKPVLPMSLLALGALLEGEFEYRIVDANLDGDVEATIVGLVASGGVRTLVVTVMPGPQLSFATPLCQRLKARFPGLTIIWGGYFPTQHWEATLRSGYVDYVVRGHGEEVLRSLLRDLRDGAECRDRAGIAYLGDDGEPVSNPLAPIPNPNLLPDFPYARVPMDRYLRRTFLGSRTIAHHSSYGCPFFCNFCAVVNMVNGKWLAQSAERTAKVVENLAGQWGANAIEFYDNNFFVQEARTAEFSERILPLGVAWWGESRIDTMLKYRDRTWELMRDSGLRMVFLGAESGSDETLKRMNKGGTASAEKTLDIARKMADYNIVPEFSFVLGNPPDPDADAAGTMDFVRKVKQANPRSEIILYMYTPVPLAGELYEQARREGFQFPATLEEWLSPDWQEFSQRRSAHMPWLGDPLRQRVRDFERVLNAYYPTSTANGLKSWSWLLRSASAWRYHLRFYRFPVELRALHRLVAYQRPETSGF